MATLDDSWIDPGDRPTNWRASEIASSEAVTRRSLYNLKKGIVNYPPQAIDCWLCRKPAQIPALIQRGMSLRRWLTLLS